MYEANHHLSVGGFMTLHGIFAEDGQSDEEEEAGEGVGHLENKLLMKADVTVIGLDAE